MKIVKKEIHSWSYLQKFNCNIFYPKNKNELNKILKYAKNSRLKIIPMGHGCSFGDQFINPKGIIINLKNLNKIKKFNSTNNTLVVEAGATVSKVNHFLFNKNLIINNIPSSVEVTVGGAISTNVFGKDSHIKGYFCDNISKIFYINDKLEIKSLSKTNNTIQFNKIIGTFGLLGLIIEVELTASKLPSQYLTSRSYYFKNIQMFFDFYKKINLKAFPFHSIKIDHFSKKEFGRVFLNLYKWDLVNSNKKLLKIKDVSSFKRFVFFGIIFYLSRKKYFKIKKIIFLFCSFFSYRFVWRIINFLYFSFIKYNQDKKNQKVHILDIYNNNNFSDHNLIFTLNGFYSFQILIPLKKSFILIPKIIKMAQDTKNESFLSHLIYLKKRNDFIYNIEDHVALVMPFLKKKRNDKQIIFINKLIKLIIKNNCQLTISKDNLLDKDSFYKIFPKVKKFKTLKKKLDKNCFFSSSYYERIL